MAAISPFLIEAPPVRVDESVSPSFTESESVVYNHSHAKMQGSRRKQSKPIRVYSDGEESDVVPAVPQVNDRDDFESTREDNLEEGEESEMEVDEHNNMDSVQGNGVHTISCDKCSRMFASHDEMIEHVQDVHPEMEDKDTETITNHKNSNPNPLFFPTAYHRLGSELQQESPSPFLKNGHDHVEEKIQSKSSNKSSSDKDKAESFLSTYHQIKNELKKQENELREQESKTISNDDSLDGKKSPVDKPNNQSPESDPKDTNGDVSFRVDGTRIFHPDAYCELCDREFCNKYFLKTHKANKHGIYEKMENASSPFSMAPFSPFFSVPQDSQTVLPSLPSLPPLTSLSSPIPIAPCPLTPIAPMPPIIPKDILPVPLSKLSPETKETTVLGEMEDYCEICQKHFCNKYYLKKHKQDVHGIVTPDNGNLSRRRMPADPLPLPSSIVTSAPSPLILPPTINSMGNLMVLNPFVPPMAIIQAQPFMQPHHLQSPASMTQIMSHQIPLTASPHISNSMPITSTSALIPSHSLSGIGALNADAYCEICRKEFCNKFFLRIHKASKHGILMDDINPIDLFASLSAPENLSKHAIKPEYELKCSPIAVGSIDASITYCNLCNQEFSSKYACKIHRMNTHGIFTDDIVVGADSDKDIKPDMDSLNMALRHSLENEKFNNNNNDKTMSTMFGSMIAAKLADRVVCDICNKELCNKYFLKAHKLKMHGIDTVSPEKDTTDKDIALNLKVEKDELTELDKQDTENCDGSKIGQTVSPQNIPDHPTEQELVKLGIDPEAYCEICKKEFCSKYFLRTHRQNIHDIVSVEPDTPTKHPPISISPHSISPSSMTLGRQPDFGVLNLSMGLSNYNRTSEVLNLSAARSPILSTWRPHESNSLTSSLSPTLSQFRPLDHNNSHSPLSKDPFDKYTWRWKEPVNSSRVTCDLCNKELCNKYFLRTHKVNKHGIPLEEQLKLCGPGSNPSPTNTSMSEPELQSTSSSPTSSISNQPIKPETPSKSHKHGKRSHTLEKLSESIKHKKEDEAMSRYAQLTKECSLCGKWFSSPKSLHKHLVKSHALQMSEEKDLPGLSLMKSEGSTTGSTTEVHQCQFCEKEFPELLSLQLHLIQDHNAQVTLKPDQPAENDSDNQSPVSMEGNREENNTPETLTVTQQTVYDSSKSNGWDIEKPKWVSSIVSVEESQDMPLNLSPNSKSFLVVHSSSVFSKPICDYPPARVSSKHYRCVRCKDKFKTRDSCVRHIRKIHIHQARGTSNRFTPYPNASRVHKCKKCTFTAEFVRTLAKHVAAKHSINYEFMNHKSHKFRHTKRVTPVARVEAMPQCLDTAEQYNLQRFRFKVKEDENTNFLESLVSLPVRSQVTSPVTLTLTLTPTKMEQ